MSKAFKCDRCKTCFDPYAIKSPRYFTTIKEFVCQNGQDVKNNEMGYFEEGVHLCPDCSMLFANFMGNNAVIFSVTEEKDEETVTCFDVDVGFICDLLSGRIKSIDSTDNAPERKKRSKKDSER